MTLTITVRAERPADAPVIADLVIRAYAAVPYSDHREHMMVERLRDSDAFLPELSLLAEVGDEAIGHILLTRATIVSGAAAVPTLALAPLSVVPEHQGRGVGARLVGTAHEIAAACGFGSIILVGLPGYYPRFGYRSLGDYPITLPFDAPAENCMIRPLRPGVLDGLAGRVRYAEAWLDH